MVPILLQMQTSSVPQAQGGVNPTLFCDSANSSGSGSSQGSTPPTPLSSACLLVAAAVGPLAPGFKFPKTKKVFAPAFLLYRSCKSKIYYISVKKIVALMSKIFWMNHWSIHQWNQQGSDQQGTLLCVLGEKLRF